jgi:tRNA(Ile)-lysidine synthase
VSKSASAADDASPISAAEANTLFDGLSSVPALMIAVSGGPDSTALMVLVARWRAALRRGPELIAVTVDHELRPESAREARSVKRLASRLGVRHRTLRWTGEKPTAGLPEAARDVRYRLLAAAARGAGATHVLTAHTRDDQAETVLMRMARGSGLTGLAGMPHETRIEDVRLTRPLLTVPKARLIATLAAVGMSFADDPTNRDPRFTRARLRGLLPVLAAEGLDAGRLVLLARRLRRADETIELAVDLAVEALFESPWPERGPITTDAERFFRLPTEVALRLLGRAIIQVGDEGPVQLAKLEMLYEMLCEAASKPGPVRLRRTLAGALIGLTGPKLAVERAPPRRSARRPQENRLTTRSSGRRKRSKHR